MSNSVTAPVAVPGTDTVRGTVTVRETDPVAAIYSTQVTERRNRALGRGGGELNLESKEWWGFDWRVRHSERSFVVRNRNREPLARALNARASKMEWALDGLRQFGES